MTTAAIRYLRAITRLRQWRHVFAGWQLGTRPDTDPECAAVMDHREVTLLLRAEVSALVRILVDAGIASQERIENAIADEADWLSEQLEARFPGFKATDEGLAIRTEEAARTMKGWRP